MTEYIVSEENAEKQIELYYGWYDIDPVEFETLGKADNTVDVAYDIMHKRLVNAIRKGRVEIREEEVKGKPSLIVEQTLQFPVGDVEKIIYREIDGIVVSMYQFGKNDNDDMKNFKRLGYISGENYKLFQSMIRGDRKVIQTLGFFFAQAE
jgi:hypothetical protein